MKEFVKDYAALCKESNKFYKKHWKGYILLSIIIAGSQFAWLFRDQIKDSIKEQFNKNKSVESE